MKLSMRHFACAAALCAALRAPAVRLSALEDRYVDRVALGARRCETALMQDALKGMRDDVTKALKEAQKRRPPAPAGE